MEEKQVNEKTEKAKKAKNRTSLKNIIGGDILATDFFRRQTKLLVMIMLLIIFYIHNRYACQQQMIEIDKLKKELIDIKYDALTRRAGSHVSKSILQVKRVTCRHPLIHRI